MWDAAIRAASLLPINKSCPVGGNFFFANNTFPCPLNDRPRRLKPPKRGKNNSGHRQLDEERGAFAGDTGAFDPDAALHRLDQAARDVQSQPGAAYRAV